jgi:predicted metal-dependent peptidase
MDDILLTRPNSYNKVLSDVIIQVDTHVLEEIDLEDFVVPAYSSKLLEYDEHTNFTAETLQNTLNTEVRGFTSSPIFKTAVSSKNTVNTDWLKKLKKHISKFTYERTNDIESTWAKYNNTYKSVFTAPGANYLTHKLKFVMSIDQSGSMTDEDIASIQEVMKIIAKDTAEATIILHDTEIADIINLVDLEEEEFKQKLIKATHRICNGGTSHKHVFEYLSNLADLEDILYISFSDNYSDIEESYKVYRKAMTKLDCIFLSTSNKQVNLNKVENIKVM